MIGMKLVIYLRVSTDNQATNGTGLDGQLAECRKWAKAHGHTVVSVCREEGVSGAKDLDARPALAEAFCTVRLAQARGIVVYRLDRLARDVILQETLLREIRNSGGELFSASESENGYLGDDDADPSRKMIRQILGSVAEYERAMIRLRTYSARKRKADAGGYAHGRPGYGYKSAGGTLVADSGELRTVSRIRDLSAQGLSTRKIAAVLDAEGVPTKQGKPWQPKTISNILNRQALATV